MAFIMSNRVGWFYCYHNILYYNYYDNRNTTETQFIFIKHNYMCKKF